jgi:hypothetical protein
MKSIIVIYSNTKIAQGAVNKYKRYVFNTDSDVQVGDMITSKEYTTKLQVVEVLDKSYKYYNQATGELSNEFNSTQQWLTKSLVIREDNQDVVYGTIERTKKDEKVSG